jgi:gephyrin
MQNLSAPKLQAAILIISDTASKDASTDKSGAVLKAIFSQDGNDKWLDPLIKIIPDDILTIQHSIQLWTDHPDPVVNLIVTTGGTGFAVRDHTPEAVAPLLHRHASGLVHAMLAASFQVTPFAAMARPVAGVRGRTVILTLPGSPKGARENLEAVVKLLPHACVQAGGVEARGLHVGGVAGLEREAGVRAGEGAGRNGVATATTSTHVHAHDHSHDHSHAHGHKIPKAHTTPSSQPQSSSISNDPALGPTHRARSSPYPLLSVSDAIATILSVAPAPTATTAPLDTNLVGAFLAEDVHAAEAVPAYRASIVDGYAVVIAEGKRTNEKGMFPVVGISHAAAGSAGGLARLAAGTVARITTGAPLPLGADAVVMVEDTLVAESATTGEGRGEEVAVTVLTDEVERGENVREPGSDVALGERVLERGQRVGGGGGEIGVLAASGVGVVPVFRRPRVGVLSTGDEVVDISTPAISGGQIRDSNRPSLLALIRSWGLCAEVVDLGIARDTPEGELESKIRDAFRTHDVDVLVTTGGVSMGELDLLKPTIERRMGGVVHFGRVAMKPGKPTTFASVVVKSADGQRGERLVFGLPGNPASALVTAGLFLLPCLRRMAGGEGKGLERVVVKLGERVRCDRSRVEYHRVVVSCGRDGVLVARSTGMQRSSRVGSLSSANALLVLPVKEGGLEEGDMCEALMMGPVLGF